MGKIPVLYFLQFFVVFLLAVIHGSILWCKNKAGTEMLKRKLHFSPLDLMPCSHFMFSQQPACNDDLSSIFGFHQHGSIFSADTFPIRAPHSPAKDLLQTRIRIPVTQVYVFKFRSQMNTGIQSCQSAFFVYCKQPLLFSDHFRCIDNAR